MKEYLKKFGVWQIMFNPSAPSNKKGKSITQKEAKKDNTIALKFHMDGLPSSVKESVGDYTSAKYLWFKLESEYQKGRPDTEKMDQESKEKPQEEVNQEEEKKEVNSNKGMDSFDCNDGRCDEIEKVLVEDDEDLSKDAKEIHLTLINIDLRANWVLNTVTPRF